MTADLADDPLDDLYPADAATTAEMARRGVQVRQHFGPLGPVRQVERPSRRQTRAAAALAAPAVKSPVKKAESPDDEGWLMLAFPVPAGEGVYALRAFASAQSGKCWYRKLRTREQAIACKRELVEAGIAYRCEKVGN